MSCDAEEILGAVLFATVFAVAGFFIGGAVLDGSWNSALLRRGLRQYDQKTGALVWTEKAGGDKGGAE